MQKTISRLAAFALLVTLTGCAALVRGGPENTGPTFPELEGSWSGTLEIDGQVLALTVEVVDQEGPDMSIVTEVPDLELETRGEGRVLPDGTTQMGFDYNIQCPGRAELIGELSSGRDALSGTLVATDCTGELRGTFSLTR